MALNEENVLARGKLDQLEMYSKADNLVFQGIPELAIPGKAR